MHSQTYIKIDYSKVFSSSKVNTFFQCKKQYQYLYVDLETKAKQYELRQLPENIFISQTIGKAVHNAITLFYHLPEEKRTEANLLLLLRDTWRSEIKPFMKPPLREWGGFKSLDEERLEYRNAQELLRNFIFLADIKPKIFLLPTKDIQNSFDDYKNSIVDINSDYKIGGKLDLVLIEGNNLHVIDFKTGKSDNVDNFQLKFYKVLIEKKFNRTVTKATYYFLLDREKKEIDMAGIDHKNSEEEILENIFMIEQEQDYTPNPTKLCNYCLFRSICPSKYKV